MDPTRTPARAEATDAAAGITTLQARYQALVEQIPAVLYINLPDLEGTTVYVSPQTEAILGIPPEAWYSGEWESFVHPDDRRSVDERYEGFLRSAREGVDEYRFVRPDGRLIWIHDRVTIIRGHDGEPVLVQGVMFDVTEQKRAQEIVHRQADLMARVDAIGKSFTDLALRGADPGQVLHALAGIVRNPVVLEDVAHQLVGYAERSVDLGVLLDRWATHSREGHPGAGAAAADGAASVQPGCSCISVRLRDEEWGRIHVLEMESDVDEIDRLALDRAAAAIGICLLSRRDSDELAETARSELIADVWQGRWLSPTELLARMDSLGAHIRTSTLVAVVAEVAQQPAVGGTPPQQGHRRAHRTLVTALREQLGAQGLAGLAAVVGERVVAVVGAPDGDAAHQVETACRNALSRSLELSSDVAVQVGVSRRVRPEALRTGLTQASEAAAYGTHSTGPSGLYLYEQLGLLQLLGPLRTGPALSQYVEDELGPLLDHDATGRTPLVDTLRAYLDVGAHKANAARALHLERRSLYYRLARIEQLLGRSLDEPASRLRIEVALHALDLLRQRPASAGGTGAGSLSPPST